MEITQCEAIHFPTAEEEEKDLQEFFAQQKSMVAERRAACEKAIPALARLAEVLKERSGQPYKLRNLLYSLWNGKPASLSELLGLDWELRKDMCAVLLAFGYEDNRVEFFYKAIQTAVTGAGQWNWFLEESENMEALEERVKAAARRRGL